MRVGGVRGDAADVRSLAADSAEILQAQVDANLAGDSGQVKRSVRGAAEHHIDGDSIVECFAGQNVGRTDVFADKIHYLHTGVTRNMCALRVHGGNCAVAGEAKAEYLGHTGHGVRGEHTGAGAAGGAHILFIFVDLFLGDVAEQGAGDHGAAGHNVDLLPLVLAG